MAKTGGFHGLPAGWGGVTALEAAGAGVAPGVGTVVAGVGGLIAAATMAGALVTDGFGVAGAGLAAIGPLKRTEP